MKSLNKLNKKLNKMQKKIDKRNNKLISKIYAYEIVTNAIVGR